MDKFKKARQLWWEYLDIQKQQRALGYHPIPPRQNGWRMELRLRDDIMRSSDARNYLLILPHVQSFAYSKTTVFRDYSTKYSIGSIVVKDTSTTQDRILTPKDLLCRGAETSDSPKWGEKYKFPAFFWRKYFWFSPPYDRWTSYGVIKESGLYRLQRPWVFEPAILPHYIDKIPIIDPALESREKEIREWIIKHEMCGYLHKRVGGYIGINCRCDYCMSMKRRGGKMSSIC